MATRIPACQEATPPKTPCRSLPNLALGVVPWIVAGALLLTAGEAAIAQDAQVSAGITTEGTGPLGLGALVGAMVAGAAALRERFKRG